MFDRHFRIARLLAQAGADVNLGNDGSVREKYMIKFPLCMAVEPEMYSAINTSLFNAKPEDMAALTGLTQFFLDQGGVFVRVSTASISLE